MHLPEFLGFTFDIPQLAVRKPFYFPAGMIFRVHADRQQFANL